MATNCETECAVNPCNSGNSSRDTNSDDGGSSDDNDEISVGDTRSSNRRNSRFTQEERQAMFTAMKSQMVGGVPFDSLSKNSQKKLVYLRLKRKRQRIRKKDNASAKRDLERDGDTADSTLHDQRVSKRIEREQQNTRLREALQTGQRIAIDCSMGDIMSPKEICRLARQISRVYSMNRAAEKPFHLYLTGLVSDSKIHREMHRQCTGFSNYLMDITPTLHHQLFPRETIVYLTPDSPNILDQLDNDKVYVLGGLVDESLENNYTYNSAQKLSVSTARLPIDVYMEKTLPSVHCALPINHVVGVLLDVYSGNDWRTSLEKHVPSRKGYVVKSAE